MKKSIRGILVGGVVCLALTMPVYAKSTSLQDLQTLQDLPGPSRPIMAEDAFGPNHWAYKTLANVSKKYGLVIGKAGDKFDGNKPLSRNEAAVLLVNLAGKIQQDNLVLSDAEKAQMDILREELSGDIAKLAGRVDKLEATVSKIQDSDKKNVKFAFGENYQITTGIQTRYSSVFKEGSTNYPENFKLDLAELGLQGKMANHVNYRLSMLPSRNIGKESSSTTMIGDMYIESDIIPKHTIQLGQTRLPIGVEGTLSPYAYDFADLSQIARTYSNTRDLGVKVKGDWKYAEYYLGGYNGARNNTTETNSAMDVSSWLTLKPFTNTKYGSFKLGGGFTNGHPGSASTETTSSNYKITGFYSEYNYKRFTLNGELLRANSESTKTGITSVAQGYQYTAKYKLTKKVELLARFDSLVPNLHADNNKISEYTLGSNYYFKNRNLMLKTNYVYVRNPGDDKNSHRLVLQTQFRM